MNTTENTATWPRPTPPPLSTQLHIRVLGDRLPSRLLDVPARGLVIGRDATCELSIDDRCVSRQHACIAVATDGSLLLVDLQSKNGTYVNDRRIKIVALEAGDRVNVGPIAAFVVEGRTPLGDLTRREFEIAQLVAEGYTNAQIALRLGVTKRTVGTHLERSFTKMSVHSRAELIALLARRGFMRS